MYDNDKISGNQVWILITLTGIGVGVFTLPRSVASIAGPDGWISVILGGLLVLLDFYIISSLAKSFPKYTLVEITNMVLGKFISLPLLFIFWAYSVVITASTIRVFAEVTKISLLKHTPIEIIILSLLVLALILVRGGIEPIARFNEITMPVLVLVIVFSILLTIPGSDFTNILPFMRTEPIKIFEAAYMTVYTYSGFEAVLLIIPFIREPDKLFKTGTTAFIVMTVLYTLAVIITYAKFGVAETKEMIWPTLTAIRSIDVQWAFVERMEGPAMTVWVLFAFTSIVPSTYVASVLPARVFKHKEFRHFCPLVVPIVYLLAMIPESVVEAYDYLDKASLYFGTPSIFLIPLLLYIVARIRKMGVKKNA